LSIAFAPATILFKAEPTKPQRDHAHAGKICLTILSIYISYTIGIDVCPENRRAVKKTMVFRFVHYILSAIIIVCLHAPARAGWTEDVRLTYRGYEILPQVVARDDTVHIAWMQLSGGHAISYIRSTDGGNCWDSLIDLTEEGHRGSDIDLCLSNSEIFIGWWDIDTNPTDWVSNIAYSTSVGGGDWLTPRYVFEQWAFGRFLEIATAFEGDSIFVAYMARYPDSTGLRPVLFCSSPDSGNTWTEPITISHIENCYRFGMETCFGSVLVYWSGINPGYTDFEVAGVVSHDGGNTWSEPIELSGVDSSSAQEPCSACDRDTGWMVVGWTDSGESHTFPGDLHLRISADGGDDWGEEIIATHHHKVASPSIEFVSDTLLAVWSDWDIPRYGGSNYEICFSKSTDLGQSWSDYERLTYAAGYSYSPWICYDNGKIHVVWYDERPPDYYADLFYKRWEPEVGIEDELGNTIPEVISLSAYPNPFNSAITITYSNLKGGEIEVFNIQGQRIKTFAISGKEGEIIWDARDALGNKVSSGIYFARARGAAGYSTIKLIYLR
jgi:hypothetical protein